MEKNAAGIIDHPDDEAVWGYGGDPDLMVIGCFDRNKMPEIGQAMKLGRYVVRRVPDIKDGVKGYWVRRERLDV